MRSAPSSRFRLRWAAIAALGKFWSLHVEMRENHEFVQSGPFRFMRHPTYFSMILETAALGLICSAWWMLAVIPFALHPGPDPAPAAGGAGARGKIRRRLPRLSAPRPDADSLQMARREISDPHRRRIVITGMGVITAPAQNLDKFWNCIRHGISGGTKMTRFPVGQRARRTSRRRSMISTPPITWTRRWPAGWTIRTATAWPRRGSPSRTRGSISRRWTRTAWASWKAPRSSGNETASKADEGLRQARLQRRRTVCPDQWLQRRGLRRDRQGTAHPRALDHAEFEQRLGQRCARLCA